MIGFPEGGSVQQCKQPRCSERYQMSVLIDQSSCRNGRAQLTRLMRFGELRV